MRLVGLISGGKDSVYNMLQCIAAGHEIVAVANIEPETKGELDSYMYQSVGHEVISLIAGALCLPIFRQKTKGRAICQSKIYTRTSQDEVEDLVSLLTKVKKDINIDGVAVGAIASDYQRTRVENVCSRLGLKSVAYLWRRNQIDLLQEMIDADMEAVIIKVACIGLNANHLGMNLKDIQPHLLDLHKKYGMNVCGEGGEYETITLDCPLFHRSITITDSEKIMLSDDPFAPVGYLNVKNASLDLKSWETDGRSVPLHEKINLIRSTVKNPYIYVQDCVDELSEAIFPQRIPSEAHDLPFPFELEESPEEGGPTYLREYWKQPSLMKPNSSLKVSPSKLDCKMDTSVMNLNFSSGWCCVGNVIGTTILDAMQCAQKHLQRMKYDLSEVVFVNIFVRDLSDFSRMNATYSSFMTEIEPPARACVETVLPPDIGVMLIVVAHKMVSKCKRVISGSTTTEREAMHVQSISHWAPANIGPYSQCITISGVYYVAGQIPLIPGTMEILNKPIFHQCKLALRHVVRILQAMNETLDYSNIFSAICYVTSAEIGSDMSSLWSYITNVTHASVAIIVVTELPKKAQLEWEILACAFNNPTVSEEIEVLDEFQIYLKKCVYQEPFTSSIVCKMSYLKKTDKPDAKSGKRFVTYKSMCNAIQHCIEFLKKDLKSSGSPLCVLKVFYKVQETAVATILNEIIPSLIESKVIATAIPVVACENPKTFLTVDRKSGCDRPSAKTFCFVRREGFTGSEARINVGIQGYF